MALVLAQEQFVLPSRSSYGRVSGRQKAYTSLQAKMPRQGGITHIVVPLGSFVLPEQPKVRPSTQTGSRPKERCSAIRQGAI